MRAREARDLAHCLLGEKGTKSIFTPSAWSLFCIPPSLLAILFKLVVLSLYIRSFALSLVLDGLLFSLRTRRGSKIINKINLTRDEI